MQKPGEVPHACFATPLPYPPIGCGGPDIRGLDLLTMPGVTRYNNGVLATGILRLLGTWDGHAMNLTQQPEAASATGETRLPSCEAPPGQAEPSGTAPLVERVIADEALLKSRGILVLEFGMCGSTLSMVVAVADPDTVKFLLDRYGQIQVTGWLKPVSD